MSAPRLRTAEAHWSLQHFGRVSTHGFASPTGKSCRSRLTWHRQLFCRKCLLVSPTTEKRRTSRETQRDPLHGSRSILNSALTIRSAAAYSSSEYRWPFFPASTDSSIRVSEIESLHQTQPDSDAFGFRNGNIISDYPAGPRLHFEKNSADIFADYAKKKKLKSSKTQQQNRGCRPARRNPGVCG